MSYTYTTQKQVRAAFWESDPELKRRFWMPTWRQNQYPTDVRVAFVDFVDHLRRNKDTSGALAQRVTL